MHIELPETVTRYFELANRGDREAMAALFAPDAVVEDEGQSHAGTAAIRTWLHEVENRYRPRYQLEAATSAGDVTTVAFVVSGSFPGSPASLRQAFTLSNGLISRLTTL